MGTNYYHHNKEACPTCGHQEPPRHIGKSSAGWAFLLHVYPDNGIHDLPDWEREWAAGVIKDEYGDVITPQKMRSIVTERYHPRGLLRDHGARRGAGTWDCLAGVDFS
jgi:hypothetical protein